MLGFWVVLQTAVFSAVILGQLCHIPHDDHRIECPAIGRISAKDCESIGCCWKENLAQTDPSVPRCFYPRNYTFLKLKHALRTRSGWRFMIEQSAEMTIRVDVSFVDRSIARIGINLDDSPTDLSAESGDLKVCVEHSPFVLRLIHKRTGQTIFDTSAGPFYAGENSIFLTTKLPSNRIYGLWQQNNTSALRKTTTRERIQMDSTIVPFVMFPDKNGGHHYGLYFDDFKSEISLEPMPALTVQTSAPNLKLYIYAGETANEVVRQHLQIVGGHPPLLPFWALGKFTLFQTSEQLSSSSSNNNNRLDCVLIDIGSRRIPDDLREIADKKVALIHGDGNDDRYQSSKLWWNRELRDKFNEFDGVFVQNAPLNFDPEDLDGKLFGADRGFKRYHLNLHHPINTDPNFAQLEIMLNNLIGHPISGVLVDSNNPYSTHTSVYFPLMIVDNQESPDDSARVKRYQIANQLYSALKTAALTKQTMIEPLFFSYPKDPTAAWIDSQFVFDKSIMVIPTHQHQQPQLNFYMPDDHNWLALFDYEHDPKSKWQKVQVQPDHYEPLIMFRKGSVQFRTIVDPSRTLLGNRYQPIKLIVVANRQGTSRGHLYWDDDDDQHALIDVWLLNSRKLIVSSNDTNVKVPLVQRIEIFGLGNQEALAVVKINSNPVDFRRENNQIVFDCEIDLTRTQQNPSYIDLE